MGDKMCEVGKIKNTIPHNNNVFFRRQARMLRNVAIVKEGSQEKEYLEERKVREKDMERMEDSSSSSSKRRGIT